MSILLSLNPMPRLVFHFQTSTLAVSMSAPSIYSSWHCEVNKAATSLLPTFNLIFPLGSFFLCGWWHSHPFCLTSQKCACLPELLDLLHLTDPQVSASLLQFPCPVQDITKFLLDTRNTPLLTGLITFNPIHLPPPTPAHTADKTCYDSSLSYHMCVHKFQIPGYD